MFTNTRLFQYNNVSSQCVYIFDNFLEDDYKNFLMEKTIELTKEDFSQKSTNVKANLSDVSSINTMEEFQKFRDKVATFCNCVIALRTPHWNQPRDIMFQNMWGMQHFKGDKTIKHSHGTVNWSGAYYMRCPDETKLYFPDVDRSEKIVENTMYLFPGEFQHYTDTHTSDTSRVSVAFNIMVNWVIEKDNLFYPADAVATYEREDK
tara:strand:- start:275 stop:892 length:618 start_codon:yes stop_codon:yes gene_type:complete